MNPRLEVRVSKEPYRPGGVILPQGEEPPVLIDLSALSHDQCEVELNRVSVCEAQQISTTAVYLIKDEQYRRGYERGFNDCLAELSLVADLRKRVSL